MDIDALDDEEFAARLRQAVALADAPAAQVHAAIALWPTAHGVLRALRRITATLSFDSRLQRPALAVRGTGNAERQLLFSSEGRDIDLRVTLIAQHVMLSGQVLGPDEGGRIDVLSTDAEPSVMTSADLSEMGEFRIESLAPGRYQLVLTFAEAEIVLPPLDLEDVRR